MSDDPWDDEDPFADPRPSRRSTPDQKAGASGRRVDDDPFGNDAPHWLSYDDTDDGDRGTLDSTKGRRRRSRWILAGVGLLVLVILAGLTMDRLRGGGDTPPTDRSPAAATPDAKALASPRAPTATPSALPRQTPSPSPPPASSPEVARGTVLVADALTSLEVKGRGPRTGYDREAFGQEWADIDRNGCDTRNDILRRDLDDVEIRPGTAGCLVERGTLVDPYGGGRLSFERGWETSSAVQIDHVVSLSNAWQTGAQYWPTKRRERFANDPLNLLAVDGPLNMQKSDGDAATWLPPNRGYWCRFVSRQVAVKAEYGLSVTPPEREAILRVLERCPDEPLVTRSR